MIEGRAMMNEGADVETSEVTPTEMNELVEEMLVDSEELDEETTIEPTQDIKEA